MKTDWGNLDCLIIDAAPGTDAIHLTLFDISSAILVTTAGKMAIMDFKKALCMFQELNIPVLEIVENMRVGIQSFSYIPNVLETSCMPLMWQSNSIV